MRKEMVVSWLSSVQTTDRCPRGDGLRSPIAFYSDWTSSNAIYITPESPACVSCDCGPSSALWLFKDADLVSADKSNFTEKLQGVEVEWKGGDMVGNKKLNVSSSAFCLYLLTSCLQFWISINKWLAIKSFISPFITKSLHHCIVRC